MGVRKKYSRRRIIETLMNLLQSGMSEKRVAEILAAYLVNSKQTRDVELYLRDLELAFAKRFNVGTAHIYSAKKLNNSIKANIKRLVKSAAEVKNVELIEEIDPGLIGGVIIRTADAELDGSIRTKLQKLRSI